MRKKYDEFCCSPNFKKKSKVNQNNDDKQLKKKGTKIPNETYI